MNTKRDTMVDNIILYFCLTPSRYQSAGCTGSRRKALLVSIFTKIVSFADLSIFTMASSIGTLVRLHSCEGMTMFTLDRTGL